MRYSIKDYKIGDIIEDYFVVSKADIKESSNGKHYMNIDLSDASGQINAKKWTLMASERDFLENIKAGDVVYATGKVKEFNGSLQMSIDMLSPTNSEEEYDKTELFKTAPEPSIDMYNFIIGKINSFEDEELKALCLSFYEENKEKLMYYPAAMKNHHAEYGGLLYHIKRMLMAGESLCNVYTYLNRDLLLAGVMIHDIEKLTEILSDKNGVSPGYSLEGQMLGHLVMGTVSISERCKKLGIGEEKTLLLQHMALTHHYEPEYGSPKKPLFPEAEMLHYLDMVDAKMFDFEEALKPVNPGNFSDRVFQLDNRKIYKRTF